MLEVEVKAKIDSPSEIEKKILDKGGTFRKEVLEEDIYFNHPKRDYAKTDEALRLRRVEGRFFLTYKGPKIDKITKTREEFQIEINDWETTTSILDALGFEEVLPIKKKRRYLQLKSYDIMLDNVEGLGNYIEVEKRGDYNPEALLRFLDMLGVAGSETRSYLELILERQKKPL